MSNNNPMKKVINPAVYGGKLLANPSKSFTQRAVAISVLANPSGQTILRNPCQSHDSKSAVKMARALGAEVDEHVDEISIRASTGVKVKQLFAGESGLGIRCFIPVASLFPEEIVFDGQGSLQSRPLDMLEGPIRQLGAKIQTTQGFLPVHIQGPIQGGHIAVDGGISSQVLTGLLIALPKAKKDSVIEVHDLKSKPYIDITLQILQDFGAVVTHDNYERFYIKGNQTYQNRTYTIEGDWSGAAFHLVGAAISGSIEVRGLNVHSKQADKQIMKALELAGAHIAFSQDKISVSKQNLTAFTFDATHCPDLFPPLSNLAAQCKGTSVIKGVSRLVHKESNRAIALQEEWKKIGIEIQIQDDEMHIYGGAIEGGTIDSHNDHRIAMMGAIAALNSKSPIAIHRAESIQKSYPHFFDDFNQLTSVK